MQHQEKVIKEIDFTVECSKFNILNFAIKTHTQSIENIFNITEEFSPKCKSVFDNEEVTPFMLCIKRWISPGIMRFTNAM